jgi:hypothetical protein
VTTSRPHRPALLTPPAIAAACFMTSVAVLLQAYLVVKVAFLLVFLGLAGWNVAKRANVVVYPRLLAFYLVIGLAGLTWAVVGLLYGANFEAGAIEGIRLYGLWSLAFVVLFTLLRAEPSLLLIHLVMITAGIGIAVVNLFGLLDFAMGWGFVSAGFRDALNLGVGIGEGYIQITSKNIGPLFLIIPYLLTQAFRTDAPTRWSWATRIALVLTLATAIASGRRALWVVVLLTPGCILALAVVTRSWHRLKKLGRRLILAGVAASVAGFILLAALPELPATSTLGRFQDAFSAQDERSIQRPYLVERFTDAPWFGAGFGSTALYLRDYERPWTGYELTYFQMLFNLGVIGLGILAALFGTYFALVALLIRRFPEGSAIPFGVTVGLIAFLIGAYSNRYFGSFDLLLFVGFLPYLATFRHGFGEAAPLQVSR